MKKAAAVLVLSTILLMTGCSNESGTTSSSSSGRSDSSSTASTLDEESESTSSMASLTWEEKQTRLDEGIKATAYYYFYHDLSGSYVPSAADETAYWMTLNYYHAIRETDIRHHSDEEAGSLNYMKEEEASDVLYSLFPDFDGTLLTDIPKDITGITVRNGIYYFEGGDFGDNDMMRIVDEPQYSSDSDFSYDVTVEQYNPYYKTVNHTYHVHIRPDQQKPYGAVIESVTEIKTDPDSTEFQVQIGERETKNYYYKDDPDGELLVKEEKMLPVFTGGDESIMDVQDQIDHLSSEISRDTREAFEEYSEDMESSDSLSKAAGLESLLSRISFDDGRYLTLEVLEQRYEGGAHGSQTYYYYVLDKEEGKRLKLSDVIGNDEDDFETLFEKHFSDTIDESETFKSASEIADEKSLDAYSFYLADDGIHIHFNRGEIGPTALADPEVIIPYSELEMKVSVGSGDQPCDDPDDFYYDL